MTEENAVTNNATATHTDPFGPVISTYSRAQAIADGVLIEAGAMAKEAGFKWPVALTRAAWSDCVQWCDADNRHQVAQDQSGRLWDVLYMAIVAIKTRRPSGHQLLFELYRVPNDGQSSKAFITTLKLIVGPGDHGEPVVTIMQPNED